MNTVSVIGVGRMGGALAIALSRVGFRVERLAYRSAVPAQTIVAAIRPSPAVISSDQLACLDSDIVLLTAGDMELADAADLAAPLMKDGAVLLHTSGALTSDVLEKAAARGVATGSMHPLVSISDPELGAERFAGAYFCVEGTPPAAAAARVIAAALGGNPFVIEKGYKPLYHASAVLASGHLAALLSAAVRTLSACGIEAALAKEILTPLVKSSVANAQAQELSAALTGPFARVDPEAVSRHLDAFEKSGLVIEKEIYICLGFEALRLAGELGGNAANLAKIRDIMMFARKARKVLK